MRILGVDPGSNVTGYAIIEQPNDKYITSGCITVRGKPLPQRLKIIFEQLTKIIQEYQPEHAAIEQVFVHLNPDGALKLGQARGVAICAITLQNLTLNEYSARAVKQAVAGYGGADKAQVQHMVKTLLHIQENIAHDASDALAIALCDSYQQNFVIKSTIENTKKTEQQDLLAQSNFFKRKRR